MADNAELETDVILTRPELAGRLKVSTQTIRRWETLEGLPRLSTPFSPRYSWLDVRAWLSRLEPKTEGVYGKK